MQRADSPAHAGNFLISSGAFGLVAKVKIRSPSSLRHDPYLDELHRRWGGRIASPSFLPKNVNNSDLAAQAESFND